MLYYGPPSPLVLAQARHLAPFFSGLLIIKSFGTSSAARAAAEDLKPKSPVPLGHGSGLLAGDCQNMPNTPFLKSRREMQAHDAAVPP